MVSLWLTSPARADDLYSLTDLGTLGGASSDATALNDNGTVVGFSTTAGGQTHAFIWTHSGGMEDMTPGSSYAQALDININDKVVGQTDSQAFRWKSASGITLIDSEELGQANGVNNSDAVIGARDLGGGSRTIEWSASNVITNLYPTTDSRGIAINNLGQFVGLTTSAFYSASATSPRQGIPGGFIPTDINDTRQITGSVSGVATLLDFDTNTTTTIGRLSSSDSFSNALGVNETGTIVGVSQGTGGFVYDSTRGELLNLTTSLAATYGGWTILTAEDINNVGQIVGVGQYNGQQHAILLSPARSWNAGDGMWSEANKWTQPGTPGAGDIIRIAPADGVSHTVSYNYTGAQVTLASLTIDLTGGNGAASTTFSMPANQLTSGPEYVGRHGTGTFNQSGGTNSIAGNNNLYIGYAAGSHGTYDLSGTGSLALGDATLAGIEYIGYNGTGAFNQSGGTNTVSSNDLVVGYNSGSVGTYALSGGTLSAGVEYLGYNGGTGTIHQTGGTNIVGTLVISNNSSSSHGTYQLDGGALSADSEIVGYIEPGAFTQTGGAHSVSQALTIDTLGAYTLGPGLLTAGNIVDYGLLTINGGTLTVGDVTLTSTSVLNIGLSGIARSGQYGALTANGTVSLAGPLVVSLKSFLPAAGNSFDILDWDTLTGTFAYVQLPGGGITWDSSQLYATGVITVSSVLLGDYNLDGVVNAADYVVWRHSLGSTTNLAADGNENGIIDPADFDVWRSHFGQTAGSLSTGPSVPEPPTLVATFLAALLCSAAGVRPLRLRAFA